MTGKDQAMPNRPLDLANATVLISNDDGIHAPGLAVLERAAKAVFKDVWTVAPETEQSAASHSLTLRRPLRIRQLTERRFAVDGTPTDSVLLGVNRVMQDVKPDIVLSGVNRGGNLGEDVIYSGTVAAAMEGTLIGLPSIAFSQAADDRANVEWATAEHWTVEVLRRLDGMTWGGEWPEGTLFNVNFPDVKAASVTGIEVVSQGRRKIGGDIQDRIDPRGEPYYWVGVLRDEERFKEGTDLEACNRGAIAVTPLTTDLTQMDVMGNLEAGLGARFR